VSRGLDLLTRKGWRFLGRRVDLAGEHCWLAGPHAVGSVVRDGWIAAEADRLGGSVESHRADAGLLADMSELDGPGFAAVDLAPAVRHFYEHTSQYRLEVWAGWRPAFWIGGALISRYFGRRVEQLALPMNPLDVAYGMDSSIRVITAADGLQIAAAWVRTLRATGAYVYSGCYSTRRRPGADRASVHVAFPLQDGNVQVFLRPDVGTGGSLWLRSIGGGFGTDGAYVVVSDHGHAYAACAPIRENFTCGSTETRSCAPTTHSHSAQPASSAFTTASIGNSPLSTPSTRPSDGSVSGHTSPSRSSGCGDGLDLDDPRWVPDVGDDHRECGPVVTDDLLTYSGIGSGVGAVAEVGRDLKEVADAHARRSKRGAIVNTCGSTSS